MPAEERLFWSVLLSVLWSVLVVLLLALLARYSFERLLFVNAIVSAVVVLGARQHLRFPAPVNRWSWAALAPAGLVALGLWLYFLLAEYVIGGRDPGTYVNEGIQIAQRGRLVLADTVVSSVPPPFRDLFFPSHRNPFYYGLRFVGFFIQDPSAGSVVGQFPHFYPASIAIGYGLNGLSGARQTVGAWAVLGLLAVYFVGARLFGRTTAGIAAALLAINVVTMWFARYPNAELVMQAQVFAALLAFARALDERQWFFPIVAGVLLGTLLFLRYDAVLPIGACLLAAALLPAVRQRIGLGFVIALGLTSAAGVWYLLVPMRAYSSYPLAFTRASGGWLLAAAGLVAWWAIPRGLAREWPARIVRQTMPVGMAGLVVFLAVYAYFFRQEGGRTAIHDAMALRTYAWYVTPWVIGVAVAGYAVFVRRLFWRDPAFFLTFATFSLFFLYKTRIVPEHFWASRRFLPMILPGTLLFVVALAGEVVGPRGLPRLLARLRGHASGGPLAGDARWPRVAGSMLLVAIMIPIAVSYWTASAPVRHHVDTRG